MIAAIPVAWLQLRHEKLRLLVALAGVAFAVVLIFMQLEFREALYASAVRYHTSLDYDLAMLSPKTDFLLVSKQFPRNRLYQVLGFDEVESVTPVYLGMAVWRHPVEPQRSRSIFAIGFDPIDHGFGRLITPENHRQLQIPYQVIFDRLSRVEYGPVADLMAGRGTVVRIEPESPSRMVASRGPKRTVLSSGVSPNPSPERTTGIPVRPEGGSTARSSRGSGGLVWNGKTPGLARALPL